MGKKITVVSSSLRGGSNSELLAKAFTSAAEKAGNEVEFVSLKGKKIAPCIGCLRCHEKGNCVISDDALRITEKLLTSDVLVFATPVYYYGMSGQLKTLLDRSNSMYFKDYRFREVYLLSSAAEKEAFEGTVEGLKWWLKCYPKAEFKGTVLAGECDGSESVKGTPFLKEAEALGERV